jgi:hypothetical protein
MSPGMYRSRRDAWPPLLYGFLGGCIFWGLLIWVASW